MRQLKERAAVESLYDTIDAVRDDLVDGIEHQGVQREIKSLNRSILTGWRECYTIAINCVGERIRRKVGANTLLVSAREYIYEMELHVSDIAFPQVTDEIQIPFEVMHTDFRLLKERLVTLIEIDTDYFTDGTDRFRLPPDGQVTIQDLTNWFDDTDGSSYPTLYCIIKFELVGC